MYCEIHPVFYGFAHLATKLECLFGRRAILL